MKVLVTGNRGYIGSAIVPLLLARDYDVVGLDSDLYRNSTYGSEPPATEQICKDIRDVEKDDLRGIDAVLHLAGLSNDLLGELDQELTYDINHKASLRLASMAKEVGARRFVFSSSCSNYGAAGDGLQNEQAPLKPVTAYARSKVLVEHDLGSLADSTFSPVYMRNATAYGVSPRMRFDLVLNNLTAWAHTTGEVLLKSDGTPWRPLVHIEDIGLAAIAMLEAPIETIHNQAFNVGRSSENYQMRDLAEVVKEIVPRATVGLSASAGPDLRNYRVSFAKYENAFPQHQLKWNVRSGAKQIYDSYTQFGLQRDEYEGPRYKRIAQIRLLLESGQLDKSLRWRN